MKKIALLLAVLCAYSINAQQVTLASSNGNIKLSVALSSSGEVRYAVNYKNKVVIAPSLLGMQLKGSVNDLKNFLLLKIDSSSFDQTWQPVWGEYASIRDHHKELTLHLKDKSGSGILLNLVFRVFDDGVGFRYEFPVQPALKYFVISNELTQFHLTGDHKTFWIPGDYDENEYEYTTSKLSEVEDWHIPLLSNNPKEINEPDEYAVQTPLMMKSADGLYINIHEAALVNYPSMQLHVDRDKHVLSCNLVPNALGEKAYLRAPAVTPWRTIIVSDKATEILSSKMILNLNEPSKIQNTSWIQPMKFMGVWWEMQTNKSGWNYDDNPDSLDAKGHLIPNHRHGANTANVKRYIDFASKHGIKGLLVEGWNTGWEEWFGNWQGGHFDFVTPAPDFDVKAIEQYAKAKGVQMIMHHETSGDASTYERQMDTAYRFMNKFGYTSVKTGYVGNIIPRGEHHDGQWMVNHYLYVAQKTAQYHIAVDMHEPVRPTGLHRTYPNFLACEAGRGNEWNAFSNGNAPEHETIMPFTRLMGGPMDYTPGIFKLRNYSSDTSHRMHTTLAKQLALYITMYSPLQMAADLPENYEAHSDAFQFIKDVPVDWRDTKILAAEPGDYIIIARQGKANGDWYIGAITDENARMFSINLSDLGLSANKKYTATIYRDADNADWKTNPEAYAIDKINVDARTVLNLKLAPGGGTAISIMPK